jgi:pimeloyl-ACP methyl ester carboxylesterase
VLLHGTPLTPEVWDDVRPLLAADTVAPDLTELVAAAPPGDVQTHVASAVLDSITDSSMVVVGHSFGGQVAIELALLAPNRVTRAIIVCSRHTPVPTFAAGARAIRGGAEVDIGASLRRWFTPEELAADGPAVGYARARLATAPRGPWAASLDAIAHYDRSSTVGRIAAPVALFAAGRDEVSPSSAMVELAAALPDGRLRVVEAWAHMSPFAHPAGFAAALQEGPD